MYSQAVGMNAIIRSAKVPGSPYTPLKTGEFRLLLLEPGVAGAPLKCKLVVCSRHNHVGYEALSYAWGNLENRVEVICNSLPLLVSENLADALRHLRSPSETRVLWVDAICIDQSDTTERGHQIQLMKSIFSEARRVLVWLGPASQSTAEAFDLINRVVRTIVHRDQWRLEDVTLPGSSPLIRVGYDFSPPGSERLSSWDFGPLIQLLNMAWFTRLWVFQEVAFAKDIMILCGERAMPRWRLAQSVLYLHRKGVLLDYGLEKATVGVKAVAEMEKIRQKAKESDMPRDLISILLATSAAKCTDPRDKIYAVLGLVDDGYERLETQIEVDYDADVGRVYQSLAEACIAKRDLRILSCVSQRQQQTALNVTTLPPSWVPDWTAVENDSPFIRYNLRTMFPEARSLYSEQQPQVTETNILQLPCIEVNEVQDVVPVTYFRKTPRSRVTQGFRKIQASGSLYNEMSVVKTAE